MAKRVRLATRAFGTEPGKPELSAVAGWISQHRGRLADLTTYQLEVPLGLQVEAGITTPSAGGVFYADRILAALGGIEDKIATGELHVDIHEVVEDAAGIVLARKGAWCAIPAPHMLGITDGYFHDAMEWNDALCGAYRTIMRAMRDTGVAGHILIGDTLDREEFGALVWQKAFFFLTDPDRDNLSSLLEHQQQIAARKEDLPLLFSLMDEYDVRGICLLDPDPSAIQTALTRFDPDQIATGGYCTEERDDYWTNLVSRASFEL